MLHVTNGSVVLSRLHDVGVPGTIVPWDDVLHEGPVPEGLPADALRRVRAEFLAFNWGAADDIEQSLAARDRALLEAASGDEIVLWFEHDLYDQLHVLQVLDLLASIRPGDGARGARVTAVLTDDYLGGQADEQFRAWFAARRPLGDEQWAAAAAAWAAYRRADPAALAAFDHPGAWPTLSNAIGRHLQQFPWTGTGLSRTEAQTIAALGEGPLPLGEAYRRANHAVETAVFMGDAPWWSHVRGLIRAPQPLIRIDGEAPPSFDHADWWRDDAAAPRLALTDAGRAVAAGAADHIALNGIDRWLGGVHLHRPPAAGRQQPAELEAARPLWRWNPNRGTVELA